MFPFTPIQPFEPMSAKEVPNGSRWIHQIKWDGVRLLTYYDGNECRLFNRKANERTLLYPELTDPSRYCNAASVILDGEVIALGENGKPSFHQVMKRDAIRKQDKIRLASQSVPISYMIFDILYLNGEWVNSKPLSERLRLLSDVLRPDQLVQIVGSFSDGEGLFRLMREQGMEGIVSKEAGSSYAFGSKDKRWMKVKNYGDLLAVIGGFTLNGGTVNSILAGVYDNEGKLYYIGHVGTGKLTRSDWTKLTADLKGDIITHRPFVNDHPDMRGATWVKPRRVVKVQYTEWRWEEGRTLRQPSIQAFVEASLEECRFPF